MILTIDKEKELQVLRSTSKQIDNINEVQELISSLKSTLKDNESSFGLSAPQIGVDKSVFIMASPYDKNNITVCINPIIIKKYKNKKGLYSETCLSIPHARVISERYKMIKVTYINEYGKKEKKILRDIEAVIFQHEFDHLNGVLMIDKDIKK